MVEYACYMTTHSEDHVVPNMAIANERIGPQMTKYSHYGMTKSSRK